MQKSNGYSDNFLTDLNISFSLKTCRFYCFCELLVFAKVYPCKIYELLYTLFK